MIKWALLAAVLLLAGGAAAWRFSTPAPLGPAELAARWTPLAPPLRGMAVYHLGHSLVGRDMPAMVGQLAEAAGLAGHRHHSQLGWGASLAQHWKGEVPGMAEENAHPAFRPAREAVGSGGYDAVVLTEMVELRDALRWHDSPRALADWARLAGPGVRLYLYETWHRLDDPAGWLERIAADRALWEGMVAGAMGRRDVPAIRVIPGGQALAAVVRAAEAGELPGLASREDFFARTPEGGVDTIHLNDLGVQVIALTHFAVLYGRSPEGLPHLLRRADGTPAEAPSAEAAAGMQQLVWQVVRGYPAAGVAGK